MRFDARRERRDCRFLSEIRNYGRVNDAAIYYPLRAEICRERETGKNCRRNDGDDPKTVDEMTRSRFLLKKSVGAREYLPLGGGFPADELR